MDLDPVFLSRLQGLATIAGARLTMGVHHVFAIGLRKRRLRVRVPRPIALALRCGAVLAPLALTGCEPGILPSQGPMRSWT